MPRCLLGTCALLLLPRANLNTTAAAQTGQNVPIVVDNTHLIYPLIVCSKCCLPIIDVTGRHSLQEFSPLVIYSNKFPHFPRKQFSRPRIIILVRCENASPTRRLRVSGAAETECGLAASSLTFISSSVTTCRIISKTLRLSHHFTATTGETDASLVIALSC